MKELLAFLMAYPLWVKITLIAFVAASALLLVVFRPEPAPEVPKPINSSTNVSVGTNNGGIVAGGDVVIQAAPSGARTEELIRIVEHRAQRIIADLAQHYKYASVQSYVTEFQRLHAAHVDALRRNNLVEAHEIVREVHSLSRKLQSDEFWTRHHRETPDVLYSLSMDAFQRGPLIKWYVGAPVMESLVEEAMQSSFGEERKAPTKVASENFYVALANAATNDQPTLPQVG